MEVPGRSSHTIEKTEMLCEPCGVENLESPANGACRECKEYMCATCFRHHLKSKHTRNHMLLALDEFSSLTLDNGSDDNRKCEKHGKENIKFYCRSHSVVGCGDCMVLEHATCIPEFIKDLSKTFKDGDMYKGIVKRVVNLEESKIDFEKAIEKCKDELEGMHEKALKEIRLFRTEINKCLDDAESSILSKLQKLAQENTEALMKVEKCLQSLTPDLEKVKQILNTQLHRESELFIDAVNYQPKLLDMEMIFENGRRDLVLKTYEFVQNRDFIGLLELAEPLGKLTINANTESKQKIFSIGVRVRRGPHWDAHKYKNQGGGRPGTVIGFLPNGKAKVKWDNGYINNYRIGHNNCYDLEII